MTTRVDGRTPWTGPPKRPHHAADPTNQPTAHHHTHRPPNRVYGPALVTALAGTRVVGTAGGYEYTLTLFHNLTQRKTSDGPSAVGVALGVWERWEVVEEGKGGFLMRFSDGEDCAAAANMSRAAVVKVGVRLI